MRYFFVFSEDRRCDDIRYWIEMIEEHPEAYRVIEIVKSTSDAECIGVVGGDGTLLHSIHKYQELSTLFMGFDRGTLGFQLNPAEDFFKFVESLQNFSEHSILRVELLEAEIHRKDGSVVKLLAHNDVYIESPSMLNGRVIAEGVYPVDRYFRANGIIISSSQGTTAYNRGAGGYILPMEEKMMAITSICSQDRPVREVVELKKVEVRVDERNSNVATADFQKVPEVKKFIVRPSGKYVRLVFTKESHYQLKRFHVEEEIEKRKNKWIIQEL